MSAKDNGQSEIERAIRHPIAWAAGGIVSVFSVIFAILGDPVGVTSTILMTLLDLAMPIFTASSIAGFTLAPEIPQIPARELQIVAIASGIVVVGLVVDRVWDSIKERVDNE